MKVISYRVFTPRPGQPLTPISYLLAHLANVPNLVITLRQVFRVGLVLIYELVIVYEGVHTREYG